MDGSLIEMLSGWEPDAIAARAAEINGKPQRIEPLAPEALSGDAKTLVDGVCAAAGATSEPTDDYFLTMVRHPELLRCQLEMGAVLFNGRLSPRERELAVLRVAWLLRAPYEWGEHVQIGKQYGISPEEIERLIHGSAGPGWSEHDAAILRGVEELLSKQAITDETWATLAKSWDEPQLIEFTVLVGQYVAIAMVQNALRIRLSGENLGLTRR